MSEKEINFNRVSDSLPAPPEFIIKQLIKDNQQLQIENASLQERLDFYESLQAGELKKLKKDIQAGRWFAENQKLRQKINSLNSDIEKLIIKLNSK